MKFITLILLSFSFSSTAFAESPKDIVFSTNPATAFVNGVLSEIRFADLIIDGCKYNRDVNFKPATNTTLTLTLPQQTYTAVTDQWNRWEIEAELLGPGKRLVKNNCKFASIADFKSFKIKMENITDSRFVITLKFNMVTGKVTLISNSGVIDGFIDTSYPPAPVITP